MPSVWPFDHHILVPCSVLNALEVLRHDVPTIHASREEEAVAIGCGLLLAGKQPLVALQNSGLANSLNTIGSLAQAYNIGLCLLVSVRGDSGDPNPAQKPIGRATRALLSALQIPHSTVHHPDELGAILPATAKTARDQQRPHAVLIDRAVVNA